MTDSDLMRVLDAYAAAVYARDVNAFVALYDEHIHVYDMWGIWSYDGAAAWRSMAEGWFGSLGGERVRVEFDDVRTTVTDGLGVIHAFATYRGLSAEGQELRSLNNRLTCVLKQSGGGWKIIHEHSSGPADFETGKVMLRKTAEG